MRTDDEIELLRAPADFELDSDHGDHDALLGTSSRTPARRKQRSTSFCTWRRKRSGARRRRCWKYAKWIPIAIATWLVFVAIFRPSYTRGQYPASWETLERKIKKGGGANGGEYWRRLPGEGGGKKRTEGGRGNPRGEKVFIAANIVDAEMIEGEWGVRVMELMDLLGEENVFLSIFENDSGPATKKALKGLGNRIKAHMPNAGQSIVSTTLPFSGVPRVKVPGKETRIKRITYLAEVRNRALLPLVGSIPSLGRWNQTGMRKTEPWDLSEHEVMPPLPEEDKKRTPELPPQWVDKPEEYKRILFLNDVVFDPREVVHLLFSTNNGSYAAACAIDYINPFKLYDTFATRDPEGFPLGVPFFPYFATSSSRARMLNTEAEVPVRSCWGGAIALNASFFIREKNPIRFRAEKEPFWDASECCLVNADIDQPERTFINPFVRVAYGRRTFDWLPTVRRIERVFAVPHRFIVWVLGMPWPGMRRTEKPGEEIKEKQWDGRKWVDGKRTAGKGGFCGGRKLLVMNEHKKDGERPWLNIPIPELPPRK